MILSFIAAAMSLTLHFLVVYAQLLACHITIYWPSGPEKLLSLIRCGEVISQMPTV